MWKHGSQKEHWRGDGISSSATGGDATKTELLRAIDVRLETAKQDLATACGCAEASGFYHEAVADLQLFAKRFGATRLNQACSKYISLYDRRPELFNNPSWKSDGDSSLSVDDDDYEPPKSKSLSSSATFPARPVEKQTEPLSQTSSRRLSVQDRINLFENKQKDRPAAVTKPSLRRLSSDVSHSHSAASLVLKKRWSGSATDMSVDFSGDNKEDEIADSVNSTIQQLTVSSSSVKSEESVGSNQVSYNLEKTTQSCLASLSTKSEDQDDSSLTAFQINYFNGGKTKQVEPCNKFDQVKDVGLVVEEMMTLRAPVPSKNPGSKIQQAFAASQQRQLEVGLLRSQPKVQYEDQFGESDPQKLNQVLKDDGYSRTPQSGKFYLGGSGSRQLKGNHQQLNDQLKMKANELEKLFAEHQLRVPGDQSNASDLGSEKTTKLSYKKQVTDPVSTHVPGQETTFDTPSQVEFSDDSRGTFYDSYMKKRDARLRELWDSNGVEKEAKMKALHDILERHSTEMKAKLSRSADKQNTASSNARRVAERLRSFNALKSKETLDYGQLQDDGDVSDFGVSRNIQGKKISPSTPGATIPRSATKLGGSTSGRRRPQSNNDPVAQCVPNLSDLRKENTKPYSAVTKAAVRSPLKNYTRRTSSNEETPSAKEEKSRRSQSLRKSSPSSLETSEGVVLTHSKNMEPKKFLRKNTGIGPGAASAKMKASMVSEATNNEVEYADLNVVKDDGDEEFESEDQVVQGVESRMSPESEKLMNSESENGNTSQSFSQVDHTLAAESESPMSWSSRTDYPFTYYTHETSDVESPMRSPASWNLQPTEAAVRMRKRWGIAQKPNLVPNSSGPESRKDMTKGFKRLLNFGRKSRYTDSLPDYISATTSEGDDDIEDKRDPANRSSDDLRKSRMGYSHGLSETDFYGDDEVHTSQSSIPAPPANFQLREDHLSGSSIKAPRSFFSLSSFRSKGSESKPR